MSDIAILIQNDALGESVSLLQEEVAACRITPYLSTFTGRVIGNDPFVDPTGDLYSQVFVAVRIDGETTRDKMATLRTWAAAGYELIITPAYIDDIATTYTCVLRPDVLIDFISTGRFGAGEVQQLIFEESTL